MPPPAATIRTQVPVPLRFSDGYACLARAFSFDGLADGREHVAFGLGDRAVPATSTENLREPLVRPHSECLTGVLRALGAPRVALLSNNPDKARQLGPLGVTVTERVPTGVHLSAANARYLATKARRGGHTLEVPPPAG